MVARRLTRSLILMAVSGVFTVIIANAQAANYNWNSTGGGANSKWSKAGNWLVGGSPPATPPGASDTATFSNAIIGTYTVDLNGNQAIGGLTFSNGGDASRIWVLGAAATTNQLALSAGTTIDVQGTTQATINAILTGTNGFEKLGTGTLTLTNTGNNYTGTTTITAGTLQLGASGVITNTSPVNVNGGTLAIGAFNETVAAVTLTSGSITGTTGVLIGTSYALESGSVTAILGGTANLSKDTAGTVTLSGNNNYSGTTTVNGGTLLVNGTQSGTGSAAVNGGTLGGTGSLGGSLTVGGSGIVRAGNGTGLGSGNLAIAGSTTVNGRQYVDLTSGTTAHQLNVGGSLVYNPGAQFTIDGHNAVGVGSYSVVIATYSGSATNAASASDFLFTNFSSLPASFISFTTSGGFATLNFTVTPEPGTVMAVSAAGLGLAGWVRRRRQAATAAPEVVA